MTNTLGTIILYQSLKKEKEKEKEKKKPQPNNDTLTEDPIY